jgi:hypothetical protein
MSKPGDINDLIRFAMSGPMWISQEMRKQIEARYPKPLVDLLYKIRADCDSPEEAWTESGSFEEAARKVEPGLRNKYPELSDESIRLLLSQAAFSWR